MVNIIFHFTDNPDSLICGQSQIRNKTPLLSPSRSAPSFPCPPFSLVQFNFTFSCAFSLLFIRVKVTYNGALEINNNLCLNFILWFVCCDASEVNFCELNFCKLFIKKRILEETQLKIIFLNIISR